MISSWWHSLPQPLFNSPYSSILLDRNNQLLEARIASDEQWRFPPSETLPSSYIKAVLLFEDKRFYTHSGVDLNVDHRVVANSVLTAFRPQPNELCKELRLFEVASATDYGNSAITGSFSPNLFIDISNEWPAKVKALEAYMEEMREYPHSRSIQGIKNLANLRGNQVGYDFAEAFEVIRKLED